MTTEELRDYQSRLSKLLRDMALTEWLPTTSPTPFPGLASKHPMAALNKDYMLAFDLLMEAGAVLKFQLDHLEGRAKDHWPSVYPEEAKQFTHIRRCGSDHR